MKRHRPKKLSLAQKFSRVCFGMACFFAIGMGGPPMFNWLFPPGPMAYCEAMVKRRLVDDCADDPNIPNGGKAATFTVRSNGKKGRVMVFKTERAYRDIQHSWKPEVADETLWPKNKPHEAYVYGSWEQKLVLYVPAPLDRIDVEDFSHFDTVDTDQVSRREVLKWWPTREHPVHTDACVHSPGCASEGKCAIYPRDPENCMAGFDDDCAVAAVCSTVDRCHAIGNGTECY